MKKVFIPIIVILVLGCLWVADLWQSAYQDLQTVQNQIQLLTTYLNQRQEEISQLGDTIKEQNGQIASLQRHYVQASKQADDALQLLDEVIGTLEETKFTFYYASLAKQRYGVDDLEEYLNRWQWIEGAYKTDEFDCSEMAAYLEWKLENEGYNTVIVGGNSPDGVGYHAWLLVETSKDRYMPIEATTYSIVYWNDPFFDNYFAYTLEYETIQDAIKLKSGAFDWWNQ